MSHIKPCLCDMQRVTNSRNVTDSVDINSEATLPELHLSEALCLEEGNNNGEKRTNCNLEETDDVRWFKL